MKVVLLSTRRLPPSYFDTVRADLGSPENLDLDVVAWIPPSGPVDGLVKSFTLVGPGRMPVAVVPPVEPVEAPVEADEVPAGVSESAKAPAPEAVTDEAAAESPTTEADEVAEGDESGGATAASSASSPAEVAAGDEAAQAEAINTAKPAPVAPKPVAKPRPTGAKRVVKAAQWRARKLRRAGGKMLPSAIKKAGPVKKLTQNRKADNLAKTYWSRVNTRADVMKTIGQADVIIALDGGSVWAGWQIGQVRTETPVVLGLPAARRELDRLVGAGQE
ncbi:hypothetical protein [Kribbella ginsengisoli]|uniref:Uncharacterized protein n=1 Tax=Kribbella ginsengisoli TaxID=363865 RepID=A0ABP6Y0J2_9ACTN